MAYAISLFLVISTVCSVGLAKKNKRDRPKALPSTKFDFSVQEVFGDEPLEVTGFYSNPSKYRWPQEVVTKASLSDELVAKIRTPGVAGQYFTSNENLETYFDDPSFVHPHPHRKLTFNLWDILNVDQFFTLNQDAAQAWDQYVKDCSQGNKEVAFKKYIFPDQCVDEKLKLLEFKSKVELFLTGQTFKPYEYMNHWKCEDSSSGESMNASNCGFVNQWENYVSRAKNIYGQLSDGDLTSFGSLIHVSDRLFAQFEVPPIHPFLFQVVKEIIADNFPFPFAQEEVFRYKNPYMRSTTIGLSLTLPQYVKHNVLVDSRHSGWGIFRPRPKAMDQTIEKQLLSLAVSMSNDNRIARLEELQKVNLYNGKEVHREWMDGFLDKVLLGMSAERLLVIMTELDDNSKARGLYPSLMNSLRYSTILASVDNNGQSQPHLPTAYSVVQLVSHLAHNQFASFQGKPVPGISAYAHDRHIYLLRYIGAWRKLRHFE